MPAARGKNMPFAFRFFQINGQSSKGGGLKWPEPDGEGNSQWVSTLYGKRRYHLSKSDNLWLWIDKILYIAEYNQHELIEDDSARLVVSDARLHKKLLSWCDETQLEFIEKCYERVESLNLSDAAKNSDPYKILEDAYKVKNLIGVAKESCELVGDNSNWQNQLIWGHINDEVAENIKIKDLA
jgi:hypothetical protein